MSRIRGRLVCWSVLAGAFCVYQRNPALMTIFGVPTSTNRTAVGICAANLNMSEWSGGYQDTRCQRTCAMSTSLCFKSRNHRDTAGEEWSGSMRWWGQNAASGARSKTGCGQEGIAERESGFSRTDQLHPSLKSMSLSIFVPSCTLYRR